MTAGRERYARIAASTGLEARDPFMDKRVIDYCSRLPGRFRLKNGRPKAILRDVMADTLPDEVLWTLRKPHLGWWFSQQVARLAANRGELDIVALQKGLSDYVDSAALRLAWQGFREGSDSEEIQYAHMLLNWLHNFAERPVVPD
jgi:asparagine synthase (glutamine-hydrolysing)